MSAIPELPLSYAEKVRNLKVGEAIEIPVKQRGNYYNRAVLACPTCKFKTQSFEGKMYLKRIS